MQEITIKINERESGCKHSEVMYNTERWRNWKHPNQKEVADGHKGT